MAFVYNVFVEYQGDAVIARAAKQIEGIEKTAKKTDAALTKMGVSLAAFGAQAIHSGLSKLKDLGAEMASSYDSAAKLSENIGVTAESVLGLRHAAELSNVGAAEMDKNMEKLSKTMFEAASGNKAASEAFQRLGVTVTSSEGGLKKSDAVLMELADKFKQLPPGAERAAAAMGIFGKSGASMVSMLKDGSGALKQMSDDGKLAAGDIDGISKTMQDLKDAGTVATAAIQGFMASLADNEAVQMAINGIKDLSKAFLEWRKASKAEEIEKKDKNLENLTNTTAEYYKKLKGIGYMEQKLSEEIEGSQAYKERAKQIETAVPRFCVHQVS